MAATEKAEIELSAAFVTYGRITNVVEHPELVAERLVRLEKARKLAGLLVVGRTRRQRQLRRLLAAQLARKND